MESKINETPREKWFRKSVDIRKKYIESLKQINRDLFEDQKKCKHVLREDGPRGECELCGENQISNPRIKSSFSIWSANHG